MKKLLKKIGCLFGYHHYNMRDMVLIPMKETETACIYAARCRCVDCGRGYAQTVTIPMPTRR